VYECVYVYNVYSTSENYLVYHVYKGPSIKYSRYFGPILTPTPVTHCHTSRDPLKYVTHLEPLPHKFLVVAYMHKYICLYRGLS